MWYEMADKKQWKRYVGYALFLFLSYSIGNAAAVVSTMTLQPEKVEKEMKTVAITFDDGPNPEYTPKLLPIRQTWCKSHSCSQSLPSKWKNNSPSPFQRIKH